MRELRFSTNYSLADIPTITQNIYIYTYYIDMWNISCSNSLDEYSTIPEIYNIQLLRNPTHELFHHILEI